MVLSDRDDFEDEEFNFPDFDEYLVRVGNNVRYFRKKGDILQQDLAKNVELTRQTILAIEKGRLNAGGYSLMKIARVLEVSVDQILEGDYSSRKR